MVGVRQVDGDDDVVLISREGKLIRIGAASVSVIGRATQGVKVMDLEGDDILVALAEVTERDAGGEGDDPPLLLEEGDLDGEPVN